LANFGGHGVEFTLQNLHKDFLFSMEVIAMKGLDALAPPA
jgi:hypothetical protein